LLIELVSGLKKLTNVNLTLPEVKELTRENGYLTSRDIDIITKIFNQVYRLDLSGNKICTDGATSIAKNIPNLKELVLCHCHLGDKEIEIIANK